MKCPYQTKVIHKPECIEGCVRRFAEDKTEFCECMKEECPFYYTIDKRRPSYHKVIEHCRRAESEETIG